MKPNSPGRSLKDYRCALTFSGGAALTLGVALSPALHAATFNVTNLNDNGAGSLRQAIVDANGAAGADTVAFQAGLTGTITLTTGQLGIIDSVDVQGPGPAVITVSGNNASRVFYLGTGSALIDVTISGLTITGGNAVRGAGVVNFDENLTLDDVVLTGNTATSGGGGLWASALSGSLGSLTIQNSSISGNDAGSDGGGIYIDNTGGPILIQNSSITGNDAGRDGGGIYIEDTGGPLLIQNTVISGNTAADDGGGIYFYDPDFDTTIRDSTISGNSAGDRGGGIYMYDTDGGQHLIERTTISGNSATSGGGVFLFEPDNHFTIESSTISGNQATAGDGGGLFVNSFGLSAELRIGHSTVAGNSATGVGGGMFMAESPRVVHHTIFGDNTAPTNPDVATASGANLEILHCLVETPGSASIINVSGNIFNQDPQLGALANNGGPTQTHLPAATSPAVDAGFPNFAPLPPIDQRGLARVTGAVQDIGAVEVNPGFVQFTVTAVAVNEADLTLTLTVTRTGGTDGAISVNYAAAPGTAVTPGDYTLADGTLNWANGDGASKTFDITIVNDFFVEPAETFTVSLSTPVGTTIGANSSVTVTINASAGPPSLVGFALTAVSVNESAGTVTLAVQRTGSSSGAVSVDYAAVAGTALLPDDFSSSAGTLNWGDGDTADKLIQVTLVQDALTELDETFTVVLSNPVNATLGNTVATVTINANAGPHGVEIPTLGWWAKLAMMIGTAFAGLWALGRRLLAVMLLSLLAAGMAFDASASATPSKGKSAKVATIKSVTSPSASTLAIELADGSIVTVGVDKLEVSDHRAESTGKGHGKANLLDGISADQPAIVKVRTDRNGDVKRVRIKLYDSLEKAAADIEAKK